MSKELRARLDEKIPRDVIRTREGNSGRTFDYLEGHYVIARMNEIFGQGNWGYTVSNLVNVFNGNTGTTEKPTYSTSYISIVKVEVPGLGPAGIFSDTGYGDGTDKYNPGKAHELASKEAVTDGLKRACKNLGMSMGLALYDKDQTNVEEKSAPRGHRAPAAVKPANGKTDTAGPSKVEAASVVSPDGVQSGATAKDNAPKERKVIEKSVNAHLRTIVAKKIKTIPELKEMVKIKFQKESYADLNIPQLETYLNDLQTMLN